MERLQQLLERYKHGDASREERAELLSLLDREGIALEAALLKAFGDGRSTMPAYLPEERAAFIMDKMRSRIGPTPEVKVLPIRKMMWVAAAAVVLVIAAMPWWYRTTKKTVAVLKAAANNEPAVVHIRNKGNMKDTILLPDGSQAILHPRSELSYAKSFHPQYRSLFLEGEACFTVVSDIKRPFTVFAGDIATTALGTRFSVSTFDTARVSVQLLEGSVVVQGKDRSVALQPVYLKPGEECAISRRSSVASVNTIRRVASTAIKNIDGSKTMMQPERDLDFVREPLVNVFKQLEKRYHITIDYSNVNISKLSFTGNVLSTDPASVVVTLICKTNDLAFQQKGDRVRITALP